MSPGAEDRLISPFEFEWGVIRRQDIADIEWICARLQEQRATLIDLGSPLSPKRESKPGRAVSIRRLNLPG